MRTGGPGLNTLEEKYGEKDAYLDIYAIRDHFVWFDQHYESKFILTTRDEDEWVQSVQRQINKRDDTPFFHHYYFENELQWRRFKRYHESLVQDYFSDNLLVMNVKDGWEPLCEFLGKDVPQLEFPHKNKS